MIEDIDPIQSTNNVAKERNEFEGLEFTSDVAISHDVAEGEERGELLGKAGEWMPYEEMQFLPKFEVNRSKIIVKSKRERRKLIGEDWRFEKLKCR
ncbi:hypothetical protein SLA2020_110620 [Shorea laevis]